MIWILNILFLLFSVDSAFAEAPVIWNGTYAKSLAAGGFQQSNNMILGVCPSVPSSGGGFAAARGSICQYDSGSNGTLYVKYGTGNTSWIDVLTGATGWSLTGNAGTTAGTNFLGTTDATDFVIKTDATEAMRVDATQNVGIGTSSPAYRLQVKAAPGVDQVMRLEGDGSGSHRNYDFAIDSSGFFSLSQNGAAFYALSIGNSGTNVGIGQFGGISGATLGVYSSDSDVTPLVLRGFAAGVANLQEWRLQDDTVVAQVDAVGNITGANLSGTNTGDVTLGTANGLSLIGQQLSLGLSSTSTTGALSYTDWNIFNGKQDALTIGDLTDAGTDGITVTGGTGAVIGSGVSLAQHVADSTHNGYLSSSDWSIFNGKGSGSVTSVDMTVPSFLSVSGNPITTNGTLAITLSGTALPVTSGGTGATSFTSNAPLIGAGTGAVSTGSRSGNTTTFGTISGSLTSGHCVQIDASGNLIDSGSACSGGGGGFSNVQTFTSSGTFTTNSSTTLIYVIGCGAGGGGGGSIANGGGGGGGGAGSLVYQRMITVSPSTAYTVTVPSGGAGGPGNSSGTATAGSAGAASTIVLSGTSLFNAPGGAGGAGASNTTGGAGATGILWGTNGGAGGNAVSNNGGVGTPGSTSYFEAGTAGANGGNPSLFTGGAGGGGGASIGNGGAGGQSANNGNNGVAGGVCAGGGGASGGTGGGTSATGGSGGRGNIVIYY